eukprot:SAG31_NODE_148_length_22511_cov_20.369266_5_plen_86_part_00
MFFKKCIHSKFSTGSYLSRNKLTQTYPQTYWILASYLYPTKVEWGSRTRTKFSTCTAAAQLWGPNYRYSYRTYVDSCQVVQYCMY